MLLTNGKIFTQDPNTPLVDSLLIDRGVIIAAGKLSDHFLHSPSAHETYDLHGQTVLPGLVDSHLHLELYGAFLISVDCETSTRADCLRRIAERVRQTPAGQWIRGHGWNHNLWPEGIGNKAQLDPITGDRPAYFTSKSVHSGWANTAALRLAGIDDQTPDPAGGIIERDAEGHTTGILLENAMLLVERIIPGPGSTHLKSMIGCALDRLAQYGLTTVHDFDSSECFSALQDLQADGRLPIRVVKGIPYESFDAACRTGLHTGFGNDHLRIGSLKLFADGALGPQTAAMLSPYEGTTDRYGLALLSEEELTAISQMAVSHGFSVAVHAIGDAANRNVVRAFERVREFERQHSLPARLHRIEHVQCITRDDIERMADARIIASMQPTHAISDWQMADRYWGARTANSYAWKSVSDAGIPLIFGSDAPVETPNPWTGLAAAVFRHPEGCSDSQGWQPEQRIPLKQALAAFTSSPAQAVGMGNRLGRLVPGYLADLIVIDHDVFTASAEQLRCTRTLATMVAGEWVWKAE